MSELIKVLYVNGNIMKRGGIESFMMNYYRRIDSRKVKIDFLVHGYEKGEFDDEIVSKGSKILHVPTKSKHPLKYQKELYNIFSSGEYDIVHSHCDAISGWILKIAAQAGVSIRIAHSHNTATLTHNVLKLWVNEYYKKQIPQYATHMFACSQAAGEWMFGLNSDFRIIPNAIELNKFAYDPSSRKQIREKYACKDNYIIGHIGRFDYQKNHKFIIKLWKEIIRIHKNYKLMFVGDGELRNEIEGMIKDAGLSETIIFAGLQENTAPYYSAFDAFILPSHFEGLPVVAIEAQASGLPCFLSKNITKEVCLTNLVERLDVNQIETWINAIKENGNSQSRCENSMLARKSISDKKYNIESAATMLENIYCEQFNDLNK